MRTKILSVLAVSALALMGLPPTAANASIDPYTRQLLTPNDFDYTGHTQRTVWNPTTGNWTVDDGFGPIHLGTAGDLPAVNNDGDGWARFGVFRPSNGTWYLAGIGGGLQTTVRFGTRGDIPVQAHYDGISENTVVAVFRPSNGTWYASGDGTLQYGQRGDIPVPGHYAGSADNDYADRPAVFRPSSGTWYRRGSSTIQFGKSGDIPIPADYNGDGTTDIAVYRPSTHTFYIRGHQPIAYGARGDIPVTADFNGDGRADISVYRPSNHTWYTVGAGSVPFGNSGDVPIGAGPYHD